jgi:hypothetical protein
MSTDAFDGGKTINLLTIDPQLAGPPAAVRYKGFMMEKSIAINKINSLFSLPDNVVTTRTI